MKTPITSSMLIAFIFASLALSPATRAVSPPPDGGYAGENTAEGDFSLFSLTSGIGNTAIGTAALYSDTAGSYNTAVGCDALNFNNVTADANTAVGYAALNDNSGSSNTALGYFALSANDTGTYNTATGYQALGFYWQSQQGSFNTANGAQALFYNLTGGNNTATGYDALYSNTTGSYNTANGVQALYSNATGISNTANGAFALQNNTTGFNSTANGVNALVSNTTGSENVATGNSALSLNTTGLNNTAEGSQALLRNTTGNSNIALGFQAGQNLTIGSSNIDIGNSGVAGDSRKIRIGSSVHKNTYIAGIYGVTASRGLAVFIEPDGHLGTTTSSARFKDEIKPMDKASEAILALRPVSFRYKREVDPNGIPQFGLVAEDVEKVNPDLVARDEQDKPYTVRYDAVNAMLLNEFLKEHCKVQELEATTIQENGKIREQEAIIAELRSTVAQQQKGMETVIGRLDEQAVQIQKVSARLKVNKPAPRVAVNNR